MKTTPISTTVAIVGGATLLGRELQDLIRDEKLRWNLHLLSGEAEGAGVLAATGEDATYLEPLTAEALREASVIFLAGTRETSLTARELRPDALFIDLTGTLETGGAKLAAPRIGVDPEAKILRIAHPAAIGLAFLLSKLPSAEQVVATVFEPASERGHTGIGELQKQSSNLLSFQPLPKEVFDAQVAFNLLGEFGEDAPIQLSAVEDRIDQDLRVLTDRGNRVSLRLMQAPVFHAYGIMAWVRLADNLAVEGQLQNDPLIDLRTPGTEGPSNSGAAQQDGFLIGSIRKDRRVANAWWIWMTFDNLRVNASNALAAARQSL